ncbi:MAG: hypothetical protein KJO73_01500 [Croceitalea sp.]|nr:hypothetical protein [Croceitalea sp.]
MELKIAFLPELLLAFKYDIHFEPQPRAVTSTRKTELSLRAVTSSGVEKRTASSQ